MNIVVQAVKEAISKRKSELMEQSRSLIVKVTKKNCFLCIHSLLGSKSRIQCCQTYTSSFTLASTINMFFIDKIIYY